MVLKRLKKYSEQILEPFSKFLSSKGVNPDHVTLLGVFFSALSGVLYFKGNIFPAGIALLFSGLCDLIDGNIARVNDKVTPFGAFLDSTVDRYSDGFVLIGILAFAFRKQDASLFIFSAAALLGSFMVSYTRARAECIIERCDVGLMERPERLVVLILSSLFGFLEAGILIIAVFANITAFQRIYHTYKETKSRG